MIQDREMWGLLGGVVGVLLVAEAVNRVLVARNKGAITPTLENLQQRIRTWWVMCAVFAVAVLTGVAGSMVLFGLISFMALREFVTLTPTRAGDHRALFWIFFVITPLQYYFVGTGNYGMFTILIPVYAFLFIPGRIVLSGDAQNFLERAAKIQWGLMICVYCVSHAPAILGLSIKGYENQNVKLLLFFVIVTQINDVLQYVWGKALGKRPIAPAISPNKTWEGFVGGTVCATLIGALLWWATPFAMWQAALISLMITLLGFVGGLTMSAIKRDRGVKDYGAVLQGHGGFLDRIDSICFAAPVFFHVTKYFFG
ncbi:MAG TPA: phosphatidate cytidylyltransferase [Abditibacteriaceae bacterium]|jgi:phosphatidate cytidylyltransferase|nr:phosphatidate cytidylyltransferase [Abditibacteriaceae bacterium]